MATIFFSYSHKDEPLRNELEAHLALLKHEGLIDSWHDRRIVAGDEIDGSIFAKLEAADIILLLVSSDFIDSQYCYSREMIRAMERHDAGEAKIIPVILRHCDWTNAPFGKLMAVPRDGRPVCSWPDRDEAFTDVAIQVRRAVEQVSTRMQRQKVSNPSAFTASSALAAIPRSSNLRIKQEFSEMDLDRFVRSGFEFICKFFDGFIQAIEARNPDVNGTIESIDSRRMAAVLYRSGKRIAECSIYIDALGRRNGIAFSYDAFVTLGSLNEMLTSEVGDQALHFKSMGMTSSNDLTKKLSYEGAAKFFWSLFIAQAQV